MCYPQTLIEQLTLNFNLWERRGRGWQVWGYPVNAEPPYIPFYHRAQQVGPVCVDDGKKHTFLSSFVDKISGLSTDKKSNELMGPSYYEDYNILPAKIVPRCYSDLHEIAISLPPKIKYNLQSAEACLLNQPYGSRPISFEIIGSGDSILTQFVCHQNDSASLALQLKAYFPEAVLQDNFHYLKTLWNDQKETLIVDFGLSQEFMRPLCRYHDLLTDPLIGIIGALEGLRSNELGAFQVIYQPCCNPWREDILRSVTDYEGKPFYIDAPEMLPLAEEKVKRPLYAVIIRIIVQSNDKSRTLDIARSLAAGLKHTSYANSNELIPLNNENYDNSLHIEDVLLRQTHRSGMILNSQELISLIHPPDASVHSSRLIRDLKKTKLAPMITRGHKLVLGTNLYQGESFSVTLDTNQRLRHIHVIGATGTGKSTLLLNLIIQDVNNGLGVTVLDPHGDLIDRITESIPEHRHGDVILLDPADSEYPIGLNILSAHSEIEKNVLSSDLVAVFKRLSTSWGDQMTSVFSNSILAFLESSERGTLLDLRRFLVEAGYRNTFLQTVTDPEVVYYWQKEFPLLSGKPQASVLTRLDSFLRPKLIRNMMAQKQGLDFANILNNRKILLAKLSQGLIGEENAYLLGTLIVSKIHQVAMARQLLRPEEREPYYLYIDEFQNFITPSMASILSGSRKYNLGLILAHQELKQILSRDAEIASSVLSNPGTRICFRLGDADAQKLADGFTYFESKDFQNLGVGEAIVRVEKSDQDFNLTIPQLIQLPAETKIKNKETVIKLSRQKYSEKLLPLNDTSNMEQSHNKESNTIYASIPNDEKASEETAIESIGLNMDSHLSSDEAIFLRFIHQNPALFVTKVYESLQLSGYRGDRMKTNLIKLGFLTQEETRQGGKGRLAKVLKLTTKGLEAVNRISSRGKGGDLHKQFQFMIKEQATLFGWKAKVEERIPHTLGSVDVGLSKEDVRIAVEISVTTHTEHEMGNIRKCLDAGYDYILCVGSDENGAQAINSNIRKHFSIKERHQIKVCCPHQVKDLLKKIDSIAIVSETSNVSEEITSQKQLLDMKEASSYLGVSATTLYTWVIQKKIPFVKVGRLNKFRKKDLDQWLERRTSQEQKQDFV